MNLDITATLLACLRAQNCVYCFFAHFVTFSFHVFLMCIGPYRVVSYSKVCTLPAPPHQTLFLHAAHLESLLSTRHTWHLATRSDPVAAILECFNRPCLVEFNDSPSLISFSVCIVFLFAFPCAGVECFGKVKWPHIM